MSWSRLPPHWKCRVSGNRDRGFESPSLRLKRPPNWRPFLIFDRHVGQICRRASANLATRFTDNLVLLVLRSFQRQRPGHVCDGHAAPNVTAIDAGGTYDGNPFAASGRATVSDARATLGLGSKLNEIYPPRGRPGRCSRETLKIGRNCRNSAARGTWARASGPLEDKNPLYRHSLPRS